MIKVKNENKILFLILNTWSNETIGIYDYSSNAIKKIKAFIRESTYVVRTKNNSFENKQQHADIDTKNGEDLLFHVNNSKNDTFILMNPIPKNLKLTEVNFEYLNNKIWYVIKTINEDNQNEIKESNEDYSLNENDIIKLGRLKYAIQKINILNRDVGDGNGAGPALPIQEIKYKINELNANLEPVFEFNHIVKKFSNYVDINEKGAIKEEMDEKACIICKGNKNFINNETDDGENFLINFCKCKEKIYHYKCLKYQLKSQMEIVEEDRKQYVDSMTFKNFDCNHCGFQFPVKFKLKGHDKIFSLVDINEPNNCDYIILETLDYKQYDRYYKSIHIIKFLKDTITVGREADNDVVDRDISISRHHALLKLKGDKIYIENISKKFGTQVLVKKPIEILDKTLYIQIGRTYIEARLITTEEFNEIMKEQKKE